MSDITPLEGKELPESCFVFKHSTACPVSSAAAEKVRSVEGAALPIYWVNVIEQRDLSNWIEDSYGIKHESPQLLKIEKTHVVKFWNHGAIDAKALKES